MIPASGWRFTLCRDLFSFVFTKVFAFSEGGETRCFFLMTSDVFFFQKKLYREGRRPRSLFWRAKRETCILLWNETAAHTMIEVHHDDYVLWDGKSTGNNITGCFTFLSLWTFIACMGKAWELPIGPYYDTLGLVCYVCLFRYNFVLFCSFLSTHLPFPSLLPTSICLPSTYSAVVLYSLGQDRRWLPLSREVVEGARPELG